MKRVSEFLAGRDGSRSSRFRAMFEVAAVGLAICQLDGSILEANAALCRMLGSGAAMSSGGDSDTVRRDLDGAKSDLRSAVVQQVLAEQVLPAKELLVELIHGDRETLEVERRWRRDGSDFCGQVTVTVGRDEQQEAGFLIVTLIDTTERKQMEERVRSAEKMEMIGRMAGAIAHDFNNLLTGILLYCDLVSDGLENGSLGLRELTRHIEEVRLAGEQGAVLTQQLLAIARKETAETVATGIDEIVAGTRNLLRRLIGERIELVLSLETPDHLVTVDPAQIRQVLLNLVLNARDAMPRAGRITVSTRVVEEAADAAGAGTQHRVSLAVNDNGCGMDAETRRRLFEPLFTTKDPGKGTGLGLATVHRIVKEAGGRIVVESEPGRGTRMEVLLPATCVGDVANRPVAESLATSAHD